MPPPDQAELEETLARLVKMLAITLPADTQYLDFTIHDEIPDYTTIYELDNGTIIYFYFVAEYLRHSWYTDSFLKERLYVKVDGDEIYATLPDIKIESFGAIDNTFYFASEKEIYTALFIPRGGWKVAYLRALEYGEEFHLGALCSRKRDDGNTYVYRMCDNPETDGMAVDKSLDRLRGLRLRLLHRDKAIYAVYTDYEGEKPFAKMIGDNAIRINVNDTSEPALYAPEEPNPYLYFAFNNHLYVLDPQSGKYLPSFWIGDYFVHQIVWIRNGTIKVVATKNVKSYTRGEKYPGPTVMTAQLPDTHFISNTVACKNIAIREVEPSNDFNEFDHLSDQCSCSICSESFDSMNCIPRVLQCGHTFCESCIHNERICIDKKVKCPNCSIVTTITVGKELPKNFSMISMAEQLMKTRVEPKVACHSCEMKLVATQMRMCNSVDCSTYQKLICPDCIIDGGHAPHVVKYDVYMESIRESARVDIAQICSKLEDKKQRVLQKSQQLVTEALAMLQSLKTNLQSAKIPDTVIAQVDNLTSEQEAREYKLIVTDLAETIINQCDDLIETFDQSLNTEYPRDLLGDK